MDTINSVTKLFIDFLSYIPGLVLQVLLLLIGLYFISDDIVINSLNLIKNNVTFSIITLLSLMYPLQVFFSYISKPIKYLIDNIFDNKKENYLKDIKDTISLSKVSLDEKSLIDVGTYIGYNIPLFFDNKIIMYKNLQNTFIGFSYYFLFLLFLYIRKSDFTNIFYLFFILLFMIFMIFILKLEINEYKKGLLASLRNIGFYFDYSKNKK